MQNKTHDATRYRLAEETAYWTARDPIDRFRTYLVHKGWWDDAKDKAWLEEASRRVEDEGRKAEGYAPPKVDAAFLHTYAQMPEDLKEQLEFMRGDLPSKKEG